METTGGNSCGLLVCMYSSMDLSSNRATYYEKPIILNFGGKKK
jgi:hypothetical protein